MELTIQTRTASADEVLHALVTHGIVIDFARANGQPIDVTPWRDAALNAPAKSLDTTGGAYGPEVNERGDAAPNPLAGIDFASDAAAEKAMGAGLTAEDFADREPSGKGGYTARDVDAILFELEKSDP